VKGFRTRTAPDPPDIDRAKGARDARARATCLVLLITAALIRSAGSSIAAADTNTVPPSVATEIARAREAVAGLDETARSAIDALLEQAVADDRAADEALEQEAATRAEAARAATEAAAYDAARRVDAAAALQAWQRRLPAREPLEALERRLGEARAEAERLRQSLTGATAAVTEVLTASDTLVEDAAAQRRLLEERRSAALSARAAFDLNPEPLARARAVAAEAAHRRAAATLVRLETARETLPARQRLLDVRRRQLERALAQAEQRAEYLHARVEERRASAVAARRKLLLDEQAELTGGPPALERIAAENVALVDRLTTMETELAETRRASESASRSATAVDEALRNTESRLALGGAEEALGLILLQERQRLTEPALLQRKLDSVRRRLASVRVRLIDLSQQSAALDDLSQAVRDAMAEHAADHEEETQDDLREGYYRLLGTRATLLPELAETTRQLAAALSEHEQALQAQLLATRRLVAILDRRLLWVPSHGSADLDWLLRHPAGWAHFFDPSRFATSWRLLRQAALRHWFAVAGMLLFVAALMIWRRRAPERLAVWAEPLKRVRDDRYGYTLNALAATLAAALPAAVAVAGLGWLLQQAGEAGKFTHSLGRGAAAASPTVFLASLLWWLTREQGLAQAHFRWRRERREALAGLYPWLLGFLLPLQAGVAVTLIWNRGPASEIPGRDLQVAWCLLSAWLIWRLLAPKGVLSSRGSAADAGAARRLLRLALPLFQVGLAGLALTGYVLTAAALAWCFWYTGLLLLGVAILHGLLSRWLLLGERRLALRRYQQKREAEGAEDRTSATGDAMPDVEPEEVTLQSVNMQTRRMLRAFTVAAVAAGILWIWSGVLPALDRLDEVVLWSVSALNADGQGVQEAVTLKGLLIGLTVLLLTAIAARNLPGLMEIGLLSRINLDAPTRYALTSVIRYLIVFAGVIGGLALLGLRWSQLQWLAAALSLGLGFGLQEIFANFVSGLILLFERPFRVGDVITIGDLTGTVTRVRTRATTLVDFDNKEIVIPNKSFITDRLVNWTLSDTRTRIILKVGVAYGSDPATVHRLLQQAAAEHPLVLDDPPPRSWFMAFGDSALEFELRVFVRAIEDRLRVLNDLNSRISGLFGEEGVEIAFPQLDLHVRGLPDRAADLAAAASPASDHDVAGITGKGEPARKQAG
jgi:potassium efflux system protein